MSWFGPGYPIKKPEQSEVVDKTEPKAAECGGSNICDEHGSFFGPPPNSPCPVCNKPTGRLQPVSSSEFDEAAFDHAFKQDPSMKELRLKDFEACRIGARFQHAKDAEEIALVRSQWAEDEALYQRAQKENQKLTEENQRLRSCFLDTEESNADMYSKCKKAEERIEKLTAALFQILNTCDRSGLRDQHVEVLYCRNVAHEALAADSGGEK